MPYFFAVYHQHPPNTTPLKSSPEKPHSILYQIKSKSSNRLRYNLNRSYASNMHHYLPSQESQVLANKRRSNQTHTHTTRNKHTRHFSRFPISRDATETFPPMHQFSSGNYFLNIWSAEKFLAETNPGFDTRSFARIRRIGG